MEYKRDDKMTTDIRNLPSIDELGENELNSLAISCQRNISDGKFSAGIQDFVFNIHGTQRWCPSKSYFRVKMKLSVDGAGAQQPAIADSLAFAENAVSNLYSNCFAYVGNVDISSITQFVGQAGMLRHRLSKPKSWLDSIGKTAYLLDSNLNNRINSVAADGKTNNPLDVSEIPVVELKTSAADGLTINPAATFTLVTASGVYTYAGIAGGAPDLRTVLSVGDILRDTGRPLNSHMVVTSITDATHFVVTGSGINGAVTGANMTIKKSVNLNKNEVVVLFQPPIGLFSTDSVLPAGSYKMSLQPRSNTIGGVQSLTKTNAGFNLDVSEIQFFMSVFRTEKEFDNGEYYLGLEEFNIQQKSVSPAGGQTSHNFTVPASTIGIGVFAQSISAGTTALVPPSVFNDETKSLNDLRHIQLTYANISKPQTDFDSEFSTTSQMMTQRYIDTQIHSGLYHLSSETFDDWLARGPLYYYSWIKSANDRSTELQLTATYNNSPVNNAIFVASIYRTLIKVVVSSGYVVSVQKLMI